MGNVANHAQDGAAPKMHMRWDPGEGAGACIVAHIRHPRGMPHGAARMLARWVRRGSAAHPYAARVQDALTQQGSRLEHEVHADSSTFSLFTADWHWGLQFLLQLLGTPVLSDDSFENLAMEYNEECKEFNLDDWLQRQRGWTSAPVETAAQLRGVWAHLYSFERVRLAVGGRIPPRPPPNLAAWMRRAVAEPPPAAAVAAWHPSEESQTLPPPLQPEYHLELRSPRARAPQVVCIFALPSRPRVYSKIIQFLVQMLFKDKCSQCPSWAKSATCSLHALGEAEMQLALVLNLSSHNQNNLSSKLTSRGVDILHLCQEHILSDETVDKALHALRSRQAVNHLQPAARLVNLLLPREDQIDFSEKLSDVHRIVRELYTKHVCCGPQALVSVHPGKCQSTSARVKIVR